MSPLSRRALMTGAAAVAAGASVAPHSAHAAAPAAGKQAAGVYRYKIGDYELTALNDGIWNRAIDDKFVRNAPYAEVQKAMEAAFIPVGTLPIPFTTLVVNTGSKLVLIDTGTGGHFGNSFRHVRGPLGHVVDVGGDLSCGHALLLDRRGDVVDALDIDDNARRKVYSGNAARLLNMTF